MTEITDLNEIKKIELNVLIEVAKLCEEQGFRYYLAGGTLIGAIRHHGFIPWDDDIDIVMPRLDYNKFISYCKNHETSFDLFAHEINEQHFRLFAKACSKETIVEEDYGMLDYYPTGVWVDVFPFDGLGNSYEGAKKIIKRYMRQQHLLTVSLWKKFINGKRSVFLEPFRFAFYLMGKFVNKKKLIQKIENKYVSIDFDKSKYCAAVCGTYGIKEIVERKFFDDSIDVEFEGHLFKAPAGYDGYLTSIYGDYMQLPPKEKQVGHHDFTAYYNDNLI